MKIMKSRLFWGAIVVAAAAVFFLPRFAASETTSPAGGFQTIALERGDINRSVSTSGTVEPLVTVEVGSQLSGKLIEVLVDFNDEVTEGQLLARIDPDTFQSRVEASQAQLNIARANLSVQRAGVARAEANLKRQQSDLARFEPLLEENAIAEIEVDATRSAYEQALADVKSAKAQVENAEAVVVQQQASLRQAQVDLDRTEIRAPINGVVVLRNVDVGQTVAASLQAPVLFEIAQDLSKIQIEADVNEADIGSVREGNTVSFSVDAFPNRNFTGEVRQVRLAPTEEANIVSYTVIINADNPGKILYPGMTASVEITTGKREDVLRIANSALRFKPENAEENAGRGNRNGGDRGNGRMERLAQQLELTDDQQKELQEKMRALFSGGRPQGDVRTAMNKVIRSVTTPEQWEKYQEQQKANTEYRPGVLYVLDESGEPAARRVRFGIADTRYTEVRTENLQEGDQIIQRQIKG